MTGSSGVVIGNLAYLVGAVLLAVVLGFVVWYRHRPPRSVESNVESFHRGLRALAPDQGTVRPIGSTARPTPTGLRIQSPHASDVEEEQETVPAAVVDAGDAEAEPIDAEPIDAAPIDAAPIDVVEVADDSEPLTVELIAGADDGDEEPEPEEPEAGSAAPELAAPVVNLTEQAHHQPAAGEAAGDWAGVETG